MRDCLTIEQFMKCDSGQLGEVELGRVRTHLANCVECKTAYDQWRSSSPVVGAETTQGVVRIAESGTSPSEKFAQSLPNIEGYRITGVLGQGGMGVVYRAVQTKLNRVVALKLLPTIVASPQAVARFRREAKAAARLHHTNIVPIYDFGESREGYFYAMELIEGQPLNDLIKKFADQNITTATQSRVATVLRKSVSGVPLLSVDDSKTTISPSMAGSIDSSSSTGKGRAYYQQVARWMADAADALHYAHNEGIIHRDIKPGNMILSSDARIMITDFGLAKCSDDESVTVPGVFMGAIRYVSPEQAMAGRVRVDHRTDIYSLGATMYELLAMQPAFSGTDDKEILASIIARDPVPLRKLVPTLPAELETICQKTLEKLPDARYETARALAEDLRRFLNDLPIMAKRPGPINRSIKFVRRHRAMVTGVTAAVMVALISIAYVTAVRKGRDSQVSALLSDADRLRQEKQWADAAETYNAALQLDTTRTQAMIHLAIVRKEQYNDLLPNEKPELLAEGASLCERVLELEPGQPRARNTLGVLRKMQNRLDEAAKIYQEEIQLAPNDPFPVGNLGAIYFLKKDPVSAEQSLRKATDLAKALGDKMGCNLFRDLAVIQFLRGDDEARGNIEQSLTCNQQDAKSLLVQARINLVGSGSNPDSARDDLAAAMRLADEKAEVRFINRYLALAHLRLRRFDEAIAYAKEALALNDKTAHNQLVIAIAEGNLQHMDAAKAAQNAAEDAWPENLQNAGDYIPSAEKGFLWFESADELIELRSEIERLLASSRLPP